MLKTAGGWGGNCKRHLCDRLVLLLVTDLVFQARNGAGKGKGGGEGLDGVLWDAWVSMGGEEGKLWMDAGGGGGEEGGEGEEGLSAIDLANLDRQQLDDLLSSSPRTLYEIHGHIRKVWAPSPPPGTLKLSVNRCPSIPIFSDCFWSSRL